MHLLAERSAVIACPVATAYDYASNLERFGEWFPGVIAIESLDALEHGVAGKQYLETVAVPLRGQRKVVLTVTDASVNRLLATEGAFYPLLPRMEIAFEPTDDGACRITWRMYSRSTRWLVRLLLFPLARAAIQPRAGAALHRLERRLTAAAS